jgi:rhodanese-related sulfurtransferase
MGTLTTKARTTEQGLREISVQDALAVRGKVRLVDVREPSEWGGELGHIAGAELVPLATVEQAAKAWDRAAELVMVCRSGGRSGRATAQLASMGFTEVYNMAGGMLAWNDAKLPVER